MPVTASGTRASRDAITAQSAGVRVGIRSKTERRSCTGLSMTLSAALSSPASWISTSMPTRSAKTVRAVASAASRGRAAATARSVEVFSS